MDETISFNSHTHTHTHKSLATTYHFRENTHSVEMTRFQTRKEEKGKRNTKNDVGHALSEASKFT
jgi:hypothetical protein